MSVLDLFLRRLFDLYSIFPFEFFTFLTSFILITVSFQLNLFCSIIHTCKSFKSNTVKWNCLWLDCRSLICIDVYVLIFSCIIIICLSVSVSVHLVVLGVRAIKRGTFLKDFVVWRKYVPLNSVWKMVWIFWSSMFVYFIEKGILFQ